MFNFFGSSTNTLGPSVIVPKGDGRLFNLCGPSINTQCYCPKGDCLTCLDPLYLTPSVALVRDGSEQCSTNVWHRQFWGNEGPLHVKIPVLWAPLQFPRRQAPKSGLSLCDLPQCGVGTTLEDIRKAFFILRCINPSRMVFICMYRVVFDL